MALLFEPWTLKGLTIKNRVMMSPMCQYSVWAGDGAPNEWHYVHYISRAVGGVGLIMMEMTDVHPDGRITVHDLGIWDDKQIDSFARIIDQVHHYGARIGIQIAHAGRKAQSPELDMVAPSPIPFSKEYRIPRELTTDEVKRLVEAFNQGARRAVQAGVDTIEIHGAHGYLVHQFMSPLSNRRTDEYGDYSRFGVEVIQAVKAAMPASMPLLMRLSATDYHSGGYSFETLKEMAWKYKEAGVDMFDVSSGGNAEVVPKTYPGYQVSFAASIRRELKTPVISVGMLEYPALAESVLQQGQADLIAIARGLLRDPYWANSAAQSLGSKVQVPEQYFRAFPRSFTEKA